MCLQTRNVVETNQCHSAVIFPVLMPCVAMQSLLDLGRPIWWPRCWPAVFSLSAWLAGVWLVFSWCLAVAAGGWAHKPGPQAPRPQPHWLAGASGAHGCLCVGPTRTMAKGHNASDSALDAALPCYASYGCVTKSCGFSCEHCGCYPPLRFCSLTFIALSHVHGESEAQGWVVRHHPEPCHWHTGLPCTQQG